MILKNNVNKNEILKSTTISTSRLKTSFSQRKVERPPYERLKQEIKELGYCETGRKYGVSDNAIRKWIKFYDNVSYYGQQH